MDTRRQIFQEFFLHYITRLGRCSPKWYLLDFQNDNFFGWSRLMKMSPDELFGFLVKAGFAMKSKGNVQERLFNCREFEKFICHHKMHDFLQIDKCEVKTFGKKKFYFI